jgi:hypothetical protein
MKLALWLTAIGLRLLCLDLSEQASSRASHITLLFDKHNAVMAVLQHDH